MEGEGGAEMDLVRAKVLVGSLMFSITENTWEP